MKGQVFIITAILVLIALLLIRINTQTFEIETESVFFETYQNLKSEIINTIDLSLINQQDVSTNLNEFILFSDELMKQRGYEQYFEYDVTSLGNQRTINLNITLKSDKSEIFENLIINRKVYS